MVNAISFMRCVECGFHRAHTAWFAVAAVAALRPRTEYMMPSLGIARREREVDDREDLAHGEIGVVEHHVTTAAGDRAGALDMASAALLDAKVTCSAGSVGGQILPGAAL